MTSLSPPSERLWWKEPIELTEIIWIVIILTWGLIMTAMMPYWHLFGNQNISNEAYRTTPEIHTEKTQAMVAKYTVRMEEGAGGVQVPVVKPPVGSDVYLFGRLWEWWPRLELEAGQKYRLHISSLDWQHGFSVQPANVNLQVVPGYDFVVTVTPNRVGKEMIICNEYCGVGHHRMTGVIYVVKSAPGGN